MDIKAIAQGIDALGKEVLLPQLGQVREQEIFRKPDGEIFTSVDLEVERQLTAMLRAGLPGSEVVSEEAFARDPASVRHLSSSGPVWIVDPLDGTTNFVQGSPKFGIIVALCQSGVPVAAWISSPADRRSAWAGVDGGTWLNGDRCLMGVGSVAPISTQSGILALGDFPQLLRQRIEEQKAVFRSTRGTHSCAHDYLDLISNVVDFAVYLRSRPWDHVAGGLLVRESGGCSQSWLHPGARIDDVQAGILAARNLEHWNELRDLLHLFPDAFVSYATQSRKA